MGTDTHHNNPGETEEGLPFVAPCRQLGIDAPVRWVKLGFRDFKQAPKQSMTYGFIMMLVTYLVGSLSFFINEYAGILGLVTGFVFLGPILAIGLYSISCQIQSGMTPVLGYCLRQGKRHLGNEAIYAVVLTVVFLLWARATSVIHIFFPENANPAWEDLLLFTGVMIAVGTVFASIIFFASAFSLPMIMDRKADAITAMLTSVHAVMKNKFVMFWWSVIIVAFVAISVLTAFIGLIFLMPVIGHATWHAYQETIDASQWPKHDD